MSTGIKLHSSDIIEWVSGYDGEKFHALLSDPPYNLDTISKRYGSKDSKPTKNTDVFKRISSGFMGQVWDTDIAFSTELWELISEILYPGAICMCFMHPRTYHRLATTVENAGYIIHPMIGWLYGQGYPKYHKVNRTLNGEDKDTWEGYTYTRSALKPALEPICVFQKPFEGKPIDSIVKTGAGGVWIEGSRIEGEPVPINVLDNWTGFGSVKRPGYKKTVNDKGRYPSNLIVSDDIDEEFTKYFYVAKPSKKEKNAGLDFDNKHPTIKPVNLAKHLATMMLPPAEYFPRRLLVPFCGTGSEVIGAHVAGWDFVEGVDLSTEFINIAEDRINNVDWNEYIKE